MKGPFQKRIDEIKAGFKGRIIIKSCDFANFFGVKSKGLKQVRGNGTLLLLEDELWFEMIIPRRQVRIPRSRITGVEVVKKFLGKRRAMSLMKVNFTNDDGIEDAAAWMVTNLDEWVQILSS
ncbi:MAG: hypothetical protein ACTSUE_21705 [Promethearchaeota archaeon]